MILKKKYKTSVVIGDPHSDPMFPNTRFKALGNYLAVNQPDNIVNLGDFLSLDSVSSHTTKKPLLREGRRLSDDLEHGREAYEFMMKPVNQLNRIRSTHKKRKYNPNKIWHNGNHEDRVFRYLTEQPELLGVLNHHDILDLEKDGWDIKKYRQYSSYEGILFTHIPQCKRVNQPISGEYVARRAADGHSSTVIFGHTHRFCIHDSKKNGAETNYGISAGWFGDYIPEYVQGNEDNCDWWGGILELTHTAPGKIIITPIDMDTLKKEYL